MSERADFLISLDLPAVIDCGRCRPLEGSYCGAHVGGRPELAAARLREDAVAYGEVGLVEASSECYELAAKIEARG